MTPSPIATATAPKKPTTTSAAAATSFAKRLLLVARRHAAGFKASVKFALFGILVLVLIVAVLVYASYAFASLRAGVQSISWQQVSGDGGDIANTVVNEILI